MPATHLEDVDRHGEATPAAPWDAAPAPPEPAPASAPMHAGTSQIQDHDVDHDFEPVAGEPVASEPPRRPPVREEPRSAFPAALRHKWPIVVVVTAALAAVGAFVGNTDAPTYTAQALLNVGTPRASVQATPGYVQAAQTLAASYSRIALSPAITEPVARDLGVRPGLVPLVVSVSPLADQGTIISIKAQANSAARAQELARAMSLQMRRNVARSQSSSTPADRIAREYTRAADRANRADLEADRLAVRRQLNPDRVSLSELTTARSRSDLLGIRKQALNNEYLTALDTDTSGAALVSLGGPAAATDDRSATTQKTAFIGAAAGLVLGLALALLADVRRHRRALLAA